MTKHRTPDELTKERGAVYGHPLEYFNTLETLMGVWLTQQMRGGNQPTGEADIADKEDPQLLYSKAVEGAVYSILGKLVRLAVTPTHRDSIQDIAGYAKTLEMCLDRWEEAQKPSETVPDKIVDDWHLKQMSKTTAKNDVIGALENPYMYPHSWYPNPTLGDGT